MASSSINERLKDPLKSLLSASAGHADGSTRSALVLATGRVRDERSAVGRAELARFQRIRERSLTIDTTRVTATHRDRVVVVTGGTGCIGTAVVRALVPLRPRRIVVLSRGRMARWPAIPGVDYVNLDIRSAEQVANLLAELRPHIVYHLAAQHDPGLAERQVARTLSTNVLGTLNVARACRRIGDVHLACASTGKALRPFSRDVYAGSKKAAEWVVRQAAADGRITTSAVRFTHVVDNSIILRRLHEWCRRDEIIRLHDANSMFYIQSAREAAALIIGSTLDPVPGVLNLEAIRDLGWPMSLLDLAIGAIEANGSHSPIHICGYEAGYESSAYPALYDPATSGNRSPLFNSLEAPGLGDSPHCPDVDRLPTHPVPDPAVGAAVVALAEAAWRRRDPDMLRDMLVGTGWSMLERAVASLPDSVLARHERLVIGSRHARWSPDDARIAAIVGDQLRARTPARAAVAV